MKIKNYAVWVLFYIITGLLASCEPVTETETIIEEKEIIVDNIIETREIVYIEKEVFIMDKEKIPAVSAIKEYDNYITINNKILGVTKDGFEEIPFIKGLFKISGVIYFSIATGEYIKNYSQENGVITEIEVSDFPEVPTSGFIEFESLPFKVKNFMYEGMQTSRAYNGSPVIGYMQIDGACMRGSDLLYSVSIGVTHRESGIYIWSLNGNPLRIMESGRIW